MKSEEEFKSALLVDFRYCERERKRDGDKERQIARQTKQTNTQTEGGREGRWKKNGRE